MFVTIATYFTIIWAWILAHKVALFPIAMVLLYLKFLAWLLKGVAVCIALLLKPDHDAHPRPLRPKGLGMKFFVEPHWDKARKLYIPSKRLL